MILFTLRGYDVLFKSFLHCCATLTLYLRKQQTLTQKEMMKSTTLWKAVWEKYIYFAFPPLP